MANVLLNTIQDTVYACYGFQQGRMSTHGLNIFFPSSESAMYHNRWLYRQYYPQVPFVEETEWLNFLQNYYKNGSRTRCSVYSLL